MLCFAFVSQATTTCRGFAATRRDAVCCFQTSLVVLTEVCMFYAAGQVKAAGLAFFFFLRGCGLWSQIQAMTICRHCCDARHIFLYKIWLNTRPVALASRVHSCCNGSAQGRQAGASFGCFICFPLAAIFLLVALFRLRWLQCSCCAGRHGPQFWGH